MKTNNNKTNTLLPPSSNESSPPPSNSASKTKPSQEQGQSNSQFYASLEKPSSGTTSSVYKEAAFNIRVSSSEAQPGQKTIEPSTFLNEDNSLTLSLNKDDCEILFKLHEGQEIDKNSPPSGLLAGILGRIGKPKNAETILEQHTKNRVLENKPLKPFDVIQHLTPSQQLFVGMVGTFHPIKGLHILQNVCENEENQYVKAKDENETNKIRKEIASELVKGLNDSQRRELDKVLTNKNMNEIIDALTDQMNILTEKGNDGQFKRASKMHEWIHNIKQAVDPNFKDLVSNNNTVSKLDQLPIDKMGLYPIKINQGTIEEVRENINQSIIRFNKKEEESKDPIVEMLTFMLESDDDNKTTPREKIKNIMKSSDFSKENLRKIHEDKDNQILEFHFKNGEVLKFSGRGCGSGEFRGKNLKETAETKDNQFNNLYELMTIGNQQFTKNSLQNIAIAEICTKATFTLNARNVQETHDIASTLIQKNQTLFDHHKMNALELLDAVTYSYRKGEGLKLQARVKEVPVK